MGSQRCSEDPSATASDKAAEQRPDAAVAALEQAASAWEGGQPLQCLALLAPLAGSSSQCQHLERPQALTLRQLQALCHISIAAGTSATGQSDAWWQLLGLRPAEAHAAAVHAAFRRLAALAHPDKCNLPRAAEAFTQLQAGVEELLRELEAGSGRRAKRRRGESGSAGLHGLGDLDDSWATAANDAEAAGFPWWGKWDEPRWAKAPPPEGGPQHTEADAELLAAMDVEQLRAEVRARQAALLAPGGSAPLELLNEGLRRARTLLSMRLEEAAARAAAQEDGGFLRS